MHDAVFVLLDGVRRADLRARRLVAVHADHGDRGDRMAPVQIVHVNHRITAMCLALGARALAGTAADAAGGVDVKLVAGHQRPVRID